MVMARCRLPNVLMRPTRLRWLQLATKEYVDTIAAAGIHYHTPVRVESPDSAGSLAATYDNGASGVGATLTNNGTQAALVIDGVTVNTNDRVLIYSQTNGYENGIYTVTNTGSASTNWVLTRATDADSYGASAQDALGEGDAFFVKEGDTGAGELYVMNTSGVITFGTTNISFTVVAETAVYEAGSGLTLDGTTFKCWRFAETQSPRCSAGPTARATAALAPPPRGACHRTGPAAAAGRVLSTKDETCRRHSRATAGPLLLGIHTRGG